jgi:type 1 glutamine amidotransferase
VIANLPRLVFHVGGPAFHPVADQARAVTAWFGEEFRCELHDGVDAFEHLDDCDLLVLMGLHWTGMTPLAYRPMQGRHRRAFEQYVRSGRPLLAHHGAVASYDDCPRFGELVGVAWVWGTTSHSPLGTHLVRVRNTNHPVVAGVDDFQIFDELYYNLKIADGLPVGVHAHASWDGADHPMVITADGGRVPGAGRMVYLANGHDLRAFESPALRELWANAVRWLLAPVPSRGAS